MSDPFFNFISLQFLILFLFSLPPILLCFFISFFLRSATRFLDQLTQFYIVRTTHLAQRTYPASTPTPPQTKSDSRYWPK